MLFIIPNLKEPIELLHGSFVRILTYYDHSVSLIRAQSKQCKLVACKSCIRVKIWPSNLLSSYIYSHVTPKLL